MKEVLMNNKQYFEFFSQDQLELIHKKSLEILSQNGVKVKNEKALRIFRENGCPVNEETKQVTIPEEIVKKALAAASETFTFYGRDPQYDITLPGDGPVFGLSGEAPHIVDLETGKVVPAAKEDLVNLAHLHQECSGYDIATIALVVNDPAGIIRTELYPTIMHCAKPIRFGPNVVENAKEALKMCSMIAGSEEAFLKRPFITFFACPMISPLTLDENSTEVIMYIVEKGLPIHFQIVPNAGVTSPLSLTATVTQANAEFLAVFALCQLITPGAPTLYSTLPTVADLRTGAYVTGGIENGMMIAALSQMARYYRLPSAGIAGMTNSKAVDVQAGYETMQSTLTAVMGGADFLEFGALLDALISFDYAHFMISDEIAKILKFLRKGFDDPALTESAISALYAVGSGGDFLTQQHTVDNIRKVSFNTPLSDRKPRSSWAAEGGITSYDLAKDSVRKILAKENTAALAPEIVEKLNKEFPALPVF
jgi:trimethylamine--corrinoid protein Co-methyltransferase